MPVLDILGGFALRGRPLRCEPYGNGHINRTWLVETDARARYILQRVNDHVFPDIPGLMENVQRVTGHLRGLGLDSRHALRLAPTRDGGCYIRHACEDAERAGYYRVYDFVEESVCLDRAERPGDFAQSGAAFGAFQMQLKDFPAATLHETIPAFHHTPKRLRRLKEAIAADTAGRAASVAREIDFALEQGECAAVMQNMLEAGELPLRVTHNDTKLNNVLLDAATREALCVIDLDTVMPGLSGHDFGDSIRFGASTAAEDEKDLDRVWMDLELFRAYARGYLGACGSALTQAELETLAIGAKLMTYECGIRFLTDHLEGDCYFRIHRPGHNLDRARTQFKLVQDMNAKMDAMLKIIREESPRSF